MAPLLRSLGGTGEYIDSHSECLIENSEFTCTRLFDCCTNQMSLLRQATKLIRFDRAAYLHNRARGTFIPGGLESGGKIQLKGDAKKSGEYTSSPKFTIDL